MPRIDGVEQNTPEWVINRVGLVTASRMGDVMAKRRDMQEAAPRRNYKTEIISEILTGRAADHYVSCEMQWGIDHQEAACFAYEVETDALTEPGGFWRHDRVKWLGASPDYLLGRDGLVEIKCPLTSTHMDYVLTGNIPDEYIWQMLTQMACTNRDWCDFVSFDPRLPATSHYRLWIRRVHRDEKLISAIEIEVAQFLKEVDLMLAKLNGEKNENHNTQCVSA